MNLIYIHGFNSSPASFKAGMLRDELKKRQASIAFFAPALPPSPANAARVLDELVQSHAPAALIGSSLGGYYATWLAERYALRAALLNPAVEPYALLANAVGRQKNLYTGEEYDFEPSYLDEMRGLEVASVTAKNYLLVVATADEVLDCRCALMKYAGARQIVIQGGDHGLSDFGGLLGDILDFCVC